jgi:hypothetical protein
MCILGLQNSITHSHAAIANYNATLGYILTTQYKLMQTLANHVEVDTRIGVGANGIYQEPLERTLEYLGLSLGPGLCLCAYIWYT